MGLHAGGIKIDSVALTAGDRLEGDLCRSADEYKDGVEIVYAIIEEPVQATRHLKRGDLHHHQHL